MPKIANKYLLLFIILVFSFAYRMLLMHWEIFPPGADIGLHNSVIHSITLSGNTDFLWNYYQMGGGISLTFPGYHIFVSYIILITGLPEFVAHSLVVSFFSSLIVFCAFLITRTMWGEPAGFIAAFLVAISRFDIEMLMWGGYPNVITLMLMPLIFYLYLQRERLSFVPFVVTATILSAALFLTHSLSAFIFVCITVATVIFATVFSKRANISRKNVVVWLLPLVLGALVISPFLIRAIPVYLRASAETFTGDVSGIRLALISTRILPLDLVLPLLICIPFFFLFSKKYKNRFLTVPALLLVVWIIIPVVLTQGFLVGFYIDYNRFLYFTILPVLILIALGIEHGSRFFAEVLSTYLTVTQKPPAAGSTKTFTSRLLPHVTSKNLYSVFVVSLLLFSFLFVPIFLTPSKGVEVQSFYQVMNNPEYDAIQWIRQNTPVGSVFVADALYGWWLSGFAQRPTLSAVEPQYLTVSREFNPAKTAVSLLDTDYLVDNGLLQVREDGGYIGRHNPMFLAKLYNVYDPYPLFHFNSSEITVFLRNGSEVQSFDLTQVPVIGMGIENSSDYASIFVNRANQLFSFTEKTTMYRGVRFVNMSFIVESLSPRCFHRLGSFRSAHKR